MSRICLLVFCALCVLLTAGWGWTDLIVWSPVPLISDPTADQIGGSGRDITGLWWSRQGGVDYFRMDLAAVPTQTILNNNYSVVYGIYLETGPGGAAANDAYVPNEFPSGTDWIVDLHAQIGGGNGQPVTNTAAHVHQYLGGGAWSTAFPMTSVPAVNQPLGTQLEWAVTGLPDILCLRGAAFDFNQSKTTWDYTEEYCTPEPGAMALMGLALPGLIVLSRKRRRK